MLGNRTDEMALFVASVDNGSLSGAARQTGLSLSSVSRHLTALEERLGVRLVAAAPRPRDYLQPAYRRLRLKRMVKRRHKPISDAEIATLAQRSRHMKVVSEQRLHMKVGSEQR